MIDLRKYTRKNNSITIYDISPYLHHVSINKNMGLIVFRNKNIIRIKLNIKDRFGVFKYEEVCDILQECNMYLEIQKLNNTIYLYILPN